MLSKTHKYFNKEYLIKQNQEIHNFLMINKNNSKQMKMKDYQNKQHL